MHLRKRKKKRKIKVDNVIDTISAAFLINYAVSKEKLLQMLQAARLNMSINGKLFGTTVAFDADQKYLFNFILFYFVYS